MGPRYAKPGSGFLHAQISQIIFQNLSGVRRIENHIALLVIIPIVNENHVFALKNKSQPPIAAYVDCPMTGKLTL